MKVYYSWIYFMFPVAIFLLLASYLTAQQDIFPKINPEDVTIVRDSFGIPHVFAKTDAEVAYGFAWANAEDAFSETQNLIYVGKGMMGRTEGIEGAKADYFIHAIDRKSTRLNSSHRT